MDIIEEISSMSGPVGDGVGDDVIGRGLDGGAAGPHIDDVPLAMRRPGVREPPTAPYPPLGMLLRYIAQPPKPGQTSTGAVTPSCLIST